MVEDVADTNLGIALLAGSCEEISCSEYGLLGPSPTLLMAATLNWYQLPSSSASTRALETVGIPAPS